MKCVGCGNLCRNTCSNGGHGWCATCRDASGYLVCSRCRQRKANAYQRSQQRAQQSRAAIAAANAPVYVPSVQVQPRKAFFLMSEAELEQWVQSINLALDDMVLRIDSYTRRRQARGTYTPTDAGIERDIRMAEDLKEALSELATLWRMAHTGVSLGSSSPPTGMIIDYDSSPGAKVKP